MDNSVETRADGIIVFKTGDRQTRETVLELGRMIDAAWDAARAEGRPALVLAIMTRGGTSNADSRRAAKEVLPAIRYDRMTSRCPRRMTSSPNFSSACRS